MSGLPEHGVMCPSPRLWRMRRAEVIAVGGVLAVAAGTVAGVMLGWAAGLIARSLVVGRGPVVAPGGAPQSPGRTPRGASPRASGTTQPQAPLRGPGGEDTPPEASEAPAREAMHTGYTGWRRLHPLSPVVRSGRGLLAVLALAGLSTSGVVGSGTGTRWYDLALPVIVAVAALVKWLLT